MLKNVKTFFTAFFFLFLGLFPYRKTFNIAQYMGPIRGSKRALKHKIVAPWNDVA